MAKAKLLKFASMWRKSSGGAGEYFSGVIGDVPPGVELKKGTRILMFSNKEPAKETSPTHFLLVEEPKKDEEPPPDW